MLVNKFVIVRSASVQGGHMLSEDGWEYRARPRVKWRVVVADSRHDTTGNSYLALSPVSENTTLKKIRVYNPSKLVDFSVEWVVAQISLHEPSVGLGDYCGFIVANGEIRQKIDPMLLAGFAVSNAVYDWQGNLIFDENYQNGDYIP